MSTFIISIHMPVDVLFVGWATACGKSTLVNISIEDATIEAYVKEKEWNNILSTGMVDVLNSEQFSVE